MVDLITGDVIQDADVRNNRWRLSNLQTDQAQRADASDQAVDEGLRKWFAQRGAVNTIGTAGAVPPSSVNAGQADIVAGAPPPQKPTALDQVGTKALLPPPPTTGGPALSAPGAPSPGAPPTAPAGTTATSLPPPPLDMGDLVARPRPGDRYATDDLVARPGEQYSVQPLGAAPPPTPAPAPAAATTPTYAQPAPSAISRIGVDRYAGLYPQLSRTPGTGRFMLGLDQQDTSRAEGMLTRMFSAMQQGDVAQAQAYAQASGFPLPPDALQRTREIQALGDAGRYMPLYQGDMRRFGQFMQHALKNARGGPPDWQGALAAVPPRNAHTADLEGWIEAYTQATGHRPSDEEIAVRGGFARPYAPSFGFGPGGAEINRRTGAPTGFVNPRATAAGAAGRPYPAQGEDGNWYYVQPATAQSPADWARDPQGTRFPAPPPRTAAGADFGAPVQTQDGTLVQPSRKAGVESRPLTVGGQPQQAAPKQFAPRAPAKAIVGKGPDGKFYFAIPQPDGSAIAVHDLEGKPIEAPAPHQGGGQNVKPQWVMTDLGVGYMAADRSVDYTVQPAPPPEKAETFGKPLATRDGTLVQPSSRGGEAKPLTVGGEQQGAAPKEFAPQRPAPVKTLPTPQGYVMVNPDGTSSPLVDAQTNEVVKPPAKGGTARDRFVRNTVTGEEGLLRGADGTFDPNYTRPAPQARPAAGGKTREQQVWDGSWSQAAREDADFSRAQTIDRRTQPQKEASIRRRAEELYRERVAGPPGAPQAGAPPGAPATVGTGTGAGAPAASRGATPAPVATYTVQSPYRFTGTTEREQRAEFDRLQPGDVFINPADQRPMRKPQQPPPQG